MVTSAHSNTISDWEESGDAITAIHGPLGADAAIGTTGARVSHGCVRLHDADLIQLRDVPAGTPVDSSLKALRRQPCAATQAPLDDGAVDLEARWHLRSHHLGFPTGSGTTPADRHSPVRPVTLLNRVLAPVSEEKHHTVHLEEWVGTDRPSRSLSQRS